MEFNSGGKTKLPQLLLSGGFSAHTVIGQHPSVS